MEFGRVEESELDTIDFSLQAEPVDNKLILNGKPAKDAQIYVGCAKWGRPEWVGKIYPLKTKEKDFLSHYVHHYNSIELNATHYKIYGAKAIDNWKQKAAGKQFKFCPKMYKGVTHFGKLTGKDFITTEFLRGIVEFKENLGPVFVQVSDAFTPKRKDELFQFMDSLPKDMQFFLEVRHPQWFADASISEELYATMRNLNVGMVITDTAGRRDCAHMHVTVPKTFIRYVGNSLHHTDYTRIDAWVQRMKYWLSNGMQELYFFMHMHNEATSPELTVYLADKMNEAGLYVQKPNFLGGSSSLFPS